jgi:hypothetical protein
LFFTKNAGEVSDQNRDDVATKKKRETADVLLGKLSSIILSTDIWTSNHWLWGVICEEFGKSAVCSLQSAPRDAVIDA